MLPNIENLDDLVLDFEETERAKTQTFGINSNNTITNKIDELDALKQSIYLLLSIEADQFIIYPYTYGIKTLDLIGKPSYYVTAILPDRIKEALLQDDRITDVTEFEFQVNKNKVTVKFVVHSIYGDVENETVVMY